MNKLKKYFNAIKFHLFIGRRYIKSNKEHKKVNVIFLSIYLGISLGLMVLVVVLGIMNGFQENHISRRIEIGSFHITLEKKEFKTFTLTEALELKIKLYSEIKELESVVAFADREVIIKKKSELFEEQIIKLRAVDPDEIKKDSRFLKYFKITYGEFDLNEYSILLGEAMGYKILSRVGSELFLTPDISLTSLKSEGVPFNTSGFFYTGSYDYDRYWGFISIYSLIPLAGRANIDGIGLKVKDKNNEKIVIKKLKEMFGDQFEIQTAEEINRGFFSALKLEKVMIIFLFAMIFIMVSINTFGAMKLTITQKKVDVSILKALGANPSDIQIIFLIESLFIGFLGSLTGIFLGCFVVYNVLNIFVLVEFVINKFIGFLSYLFEFAFKGFYFSPIRIYDTSVYYQTTFLVKINLVEIILISLFIITVTVFAAYIPVSKSSQLKPNDVLKS
ncbi:MAG: hypothetical protein A2086_11555 [Spirochaetes bacterium GWD1_27_9]|nr:MAG: hypothetical protein A2Z98_04680 [Spirochaetes bacterium GWB1_27_13]OHD21934.1 MAG: hypothetical protein A2Y34_05375 [Spirochaetes bacterium GWC1_27_15]OHD36564.1 MAG: hypothetical protein A2086_11555 [Spirochaetes bacterium GWD1_27_9]